MDVHETHALSMVPVDNCEQMCARVHARRGARRRARAPLATGGAGDTRCPRRTPTLIVAKGVGSAPIRSAAFSPDGKQLATVGDDRRARQERLRRGGPRVVGAAAALRRRTVTRRGGLGRRGRRGAGRVAAEGGVASELARHVAVSHRAGWRGRGARRHAQHTGRLALNRTGARDGSGRRANVRRHRVYRAACEADRSRRHEV